MIPVLTDSYLYSYESQDIKTLLDNSCFIGINAHANKNLLRIFANLTGVFEDTERVTIGSVIFDSLIWPNGKSLQIPDNLCLTKHTSNDVECIDGIPDILYLPHNEVDRSCLLSPTYDRNPVPELFPGPRSVETLVSFINSKCYTFKLPSGALSSAGLHREYILANVFHVSDTSDMDMGTLYSTTNNPLNSSYIRNRSNAKLSQHTCSKDDISCNSKNSRHANYYTKDKPTEIPKCETVNSSLSKDDFVNRYLKKSKPFILKNAINNWPGFSKWTQEFLYTQFGERNVHIKMTPGGDFEGVEKSSLWEEYKSFKIPDEVREKLSFPDLVVVRPAGVNVRFSEFLDLITWAAEQPSRNVSAYLEYSSILEYMPELQEDLEAFKFVKDLLTLKHLNMWLSDGNTLGRLHFDPYDNFLCQLRGKKQVILFEPFDNTKLYESHIPQATLSYTKEKHAFRRKTLEDSTSMVMSPVDLLNPDFERFPKFAETYPMNCTIDEGDALYMPAFWWHEVYSWPNRQEKRNLAVNFWYEPFLQKEFPCPECPMDVNPHYSHLLY